MSSSLGERAARAALSLGPVAPTLSGQAQLKAPILGGKEGVHLMCPGFFKVCVRGCSAKEFQLPLISLL